MNSDLAVQMQDLLRRLCIRGRGESVAQARWRVAQRLNLPERTVRGLLSGEAGCLSSARAEAILRDETTLLRAHLAQAEAELRKLEDDAAALRQRLQTLEGKTCSTDQAGGALSRGGSAGGHGRFGPAQGTAMRQWHTPWTGPTAEGDVDGAWPVRS